MNINSKIAGTERRTRQREALLRVFAASTRPLTPQEALVEARRFAKGIGIATVYRTLKLLAQEGSLTAVELANEPVRYEPADRGHHHHFRCDDCRRVFEMPGCTPDVRTLAPAGFSVRDHEITLYGVCRDCRRGSRKPARRSARGT
jgi:Fur family ferric uptake transcriptional regulator